MREGRDEGEISDYFASFFKNQAFINTLLESKQIWPRQPWPPSACESRDAMAIIGEELHGELIRVLSAVLHPF